MLIRVLVPFWAPVAAISLRDCHFIYSRYSGFLRIASPTVLHFLESFTAVREPNISEWRRRAFGDLTSAFRFGAAGGKPPVLPDTSGPLSLAKYEAANLPNPVLPNGSQQPPKQEKAPATPFRRVPPLRTTDSRYHRFLSSGRRPRAPWQGRVVDSSGAILQRPDHNVERERRIHDYGGAPARLMVFFRP
jgi:hypothetical protein